MDGGAPWTLLKLNVYPTPHAGGLNPGNQSISGQREDANDFLVNGGDVNEEMNAALRSYPISIRLPTPDFKIPYCPDATIFHRGWAWPARPA